VASRPATEQSIRLLANFMLNLQVVYQGRFRIRWVLTP
jgi:hypothetical protein